MTDQERLLAAEMMLEKYSTSIPRPVTIVLRFVFELARDGVTFREIAVKQKGAPALNLDDTKENETHVN